MPGHIFTVTKSSENIGVMPCWVILPGGYDDKLKDVRFEACVAQRTAAFMLEASSVVAPISSMHILCTTDVSSTAEQRMTIFFASYFFRGMLNAI